MEAVEFIITLQKMCTGRHCDDCPLHDIDRCDVRYVEDPEETVRIVEEWAKDQESEKTEHQEESRDLHAIIDELEDRIDKLEKKVSNEALIFREVSKLNQKNAQETRRQNRCIGEIHSRINKRTETDEQGCSA